MNKKTIRIISVIIYIIAMVMLTFIMVPLIKSYDEPQKFVSAIKEYGAYANIMMFFIQIAQIVVALIPGELIEFVAGTLYGWLGGLIFCLAGILVGQTIIFAAVKTLGKDFVEKAAGSDSLKKFKFLQDERKLKTLIFILFFIPGTPKDLITYVAPLTKIKLKEFLCITLIARIPSVVSSTYAGDAYSENQFWHMAIAYGVILVVSLIGVFIYKKIEKKRMSKSTENMD